jgi:hypothetical protein
LIKRFQQPLIKFYCNNSCFFCTLKYHFIQECTRNGTFQKKKKSKKELSLRKFHWIMLTLKLKVKNSPAVSDFCKNYSFLYRKLYANFELFKEENFKKELQTKYHLDSWFYESCGIEVQTKLAQEKTHQEKQAAQIQGIEKELSETQNEGRKGKRKTFRLHRKLADLQARQGKGITFGGLKTLRRISFLSNAAEENQSEITELQQKYQAQRVLPIYSVGEAPQKSNRKFEFDLENQTLFFKPAKKTKLKIEFHVSKNQQKS